MSSDANLDSDIYFIFCSFCIFSIHNNSSSSPSKKSWTSLWTAIKRRQCNIPLGHWHWGGQCQYYTWWHWSPCTLHRCRNISFDGFNPSPLQKRNLAGKATSLPKDRRRWWLYIVIIWWRQSVRLSQKYKEKE